MIVIPNDTKQIALATDMLPAMEEEFTKFFMVSTDTCTINNKSHIIVGCHITSNHTIREIKFDTTTNNKFIDWLKKEKIFVDSDSLGINKTVTIGYLLKLHNRLTNRTTLKEYLEEELNDVHIDPDLAVKLDPELKETQLAAMSNGDIFVPAPPPFEIYQMEISYGRDKERGKTEVLGIKCSGAKARLLKEFFSQMAPPVEMEIRTGMFVPTGVAHIIGPEAYANLLCMNNSFLQSITMIPVGDFQHETLEIPFSIDQHTDIEQTNLSQVILSQVWCINFERTITKNKILILTTKVQLPTARKWIDMMLPDIYEQHISDKIDVTTLKQLKPRCLDKLIKTVAVETYAAKLKH